MLGCLWFEFGYACLVVVNRCLNRLHSIRHARKTVTHFLTELLEFGFHSTDFSLQFSPQLSLEFGCLLTKLLANCSSYELF